MKKYMRFIILGLFLMSVLSVGVAAQASSNIFASFGNTVKDIVVGLTSVKVDMPNQQYFESLPGVDSDVNPTIFGLLLVFILMFSLFWIGTGTMEHFKREAGARKGLCFALAAMVGFLSPLAWYVQKLLNTLSSLLPILIITTVVIIVWWFWGIFSRHRMGQGVLNMKARADNKKIRADTDKVERSADASLDLGAREGKAIGEIKALSRTWFKDVTNRKQTLKRIKKLIAKAGSVTGAEQQQLVTSIGDEVANLLKVTNHEKTIQATYKSVIGMLDQTTMTQIKDLEATSNEDQALLQDQIMADEGKSAAEAGALIKNAITMAQNAETIIQQIRRDVNIDANWTSNVTGLVVQLKENLRGGSFSQANDTIEKIWEEMENDSSMIQRMRPLVAKLKALNQADYKMVAKARGLVH